MKLLMTYQLHGPTVTPQECLHRFIIALNPTHQMLLENTCAMDMNSMLGIEETAQIIYDKLAQRELQDSIKLETMPKTYGNAHTYRTKDSRQFHCYICGRNNHEFMYCYSLSAETRRELQQKCFQHTQSDHYDTCNTPHDRSRSPRSHHRRLILSRRDDNRTRNYTRYPTSHRNHHSRSNYRSRSPSPYRPRERYSSRNSVRQLTPRPHPSPSESHASDSDSQMYDPQKAVPCSPTPQVRMTQARQFHHTDGCQPDHIAIYDTGTFNPTSPYRRYLHDYEEFTEPRTITLAVSTQTSRAFGRGTIYLDPPATHPNTTPIKITNVWYTPDFQETLIPDTSITTPKRAILTRMRQHHLLTYDKYDNILHSTPFMHYDHIDKKTVIDWHLHPISSLHTVHFTGDNTPKPRSSPQPFDITTWHQRFGHLHFQMLNLLPIISTT